MTRSAFSVRLAAGAASFVCAAGTAAAQRPNPSAASADGYVTLRGADTVAVEQVTRDGAGGAVSELRLGVASGAPVGLRLRTRTAAGADAATTRVDAEVVPPGGLAPAQRVTIVFGPGDSATVRAGNGPAQRVPAARGAVAYTNLSVVSIEHILRRARVLAGATGRAASVPVLVGGGTQAAVAFLGPDSATVTLGGVTLRVARAPDGRVLGFTVPSQGVRAVRVPAAPPSATPTAPAPGPAPRDQRVRR